MICWYFVEQKLPYPHRATTLISQPAGQAFVMIKLNGKISVIFFNSFPLADNFLPINSQLSFGQKFHNRKLSYINTNTKLLLCWSLTRSYMSSAVKFNQQANGFRFSLNESKTFALTFIGPLDHWSFRFSSHFAVYTRKWCAST